VSPQALGWDHPDTARYYARFRRRFARYRQANRQIARRAALGPGMRVLDVAAGDGGTTAEMLPLLGDLGTVLCYEPAAAMRALGESSLADHRVTWTGEWPSGSGRFDRVVCGAAIWQLEPLDETFRALHGLLVAGGCICFDIPALYLGEADEPGGGGDPMLLGLPAALAMTRGRRDGPVPSPRATLDTASVDRWLTRAGFRVERWSFSARWGQRAYREWLKIPPTTDHLLVGMSADERAAAIDRAFASVDPGSWRWERWLGWTAWRPRL
jgi:SAM-dependent methyltransferase